MALLGACDTQTRPDIPKDEMQKILIDLHYAEAWSIIQNRDSIRHNTNIRNPDSLAKYYKTILNHYGLSADELIKNLEWYKLHPDELDSIYIYMIPKTSSLENYFLERHEAMKANP